MIAARRSEFGAAWQELAAHDAQHDHQAYEELEEADDHQGGVDAGHLADELHWNASLAAADTPLIVEKLRLAGVEGEVPDRYGAADVPARLPRRPGGLEGPEYAEAGDARLRSLWGVRPAATVSAAMGECWKSRGTRA